MRSNTDIQLLDLNERLVKIKENTDNTFGGSPYFGIDGKITFPRDYEDGNEFKPLGFDESLSYKHNINSGSALNVVLKNSLSNGFQFYGNDIYSQTTMLTLTLTQSLAPAWARGQKKDPYKEKLIYSSLQARYNREVSEKNIIQNVTICYIQLRYYLRMINLYRDTIEKYKSLIDCLEAMKDEISINLKNEIAAYRDRLWIYVTKLSDYVENYSSLQSSLNTYCGTQFIVTSIEELPVIDSALFEYDPTVKKMDVDEAMIKYEKMLNSQSLSPYLTLTAGVTNKSEVESWDDYWDGYSEWGNWTWYVSVGFDLSRLVSPKHKISEAEYNAKLEQLRMNKIKHDEEKRNNYDYYNTLLEEANERSVIANDSLLFFKGRYDQAANMKVGEDISEVTLALCEIAYKEMKNSSETIRDEIWLYAWLMNNIN